METTTLSAEFAPMGLAIFVLLLHFLGDFICQSDWMAKNKSKSMEALSVHCAIYGSVLISGMLLFSAVGGWASGAGLDRGELWQAVLYGVLNMALHFGVDFATSRINSWLYSNSSTHWFFVGIGFDQLIHAATLLVLLPVVFPAS